MKRRLTFTMTQDGFPDLPDLTVLPIDAMIEVASIIGLRRAVLVMRAMDRLTK